MKAINPQSNEVVLAPEEEVYQREIFCDDVHFLSISGLQKGESISGKVKIRYHHEGAEAVIEGCGENTVHIHFEEAVKAPTPGQSAVFYDLEGCIIAGGIIKNNIS